MDDRERALNHRVINERDVTEDLTQPRVQHDDIGGAHAPTVARATPAEPRRRNAKASKLAQEDIDKLDERAKKRVVGRWNSRVRGLKRKMDDIADQFPTSSIVLLFTKPFQSRGRLGRWYAVLTVVEACMAYFVRLDVYNARA